MAADLTTHDPAVVTDDDYARAESMLAPHRARLVPTVVPRWRDDGRFTYVLGERTVVVGPAAGTRREATAAELAGELADAPSALPSELRSPDGRRTAFARAGEVWVRSADEEEVALTDAAEPGLAHGALPDPMVGRMALRDLGPEFRPFVAFWSPDSTRLLVPLLDERGLPETVLVESAPRDGSRPRAHTLRYPMPGDPVAQVSWLVLHVDDRRVVPAQAPPEPVMHPADLVYPWWHGDGAAVLRMRRSRDGRTLDLVRLDPDTGATTVLVTESGTTRVDPTPEPGDPPMTQVLATGEILWWSQRDGRAHLYLHPGDGGPPRLLTPGDALVRRVLAVDEDRREALVVVAGLVPDDPYIRQLARVDLDGAGLTRLTDDRLDHDALAPPGGGYLVDRASDVATPPRARVLDRQGRVLVELEAPDTAALAARGWSPPERFRVVAADGVTPIFGLLWRPHGFDPARRYPVVDSIYPGPHTHRAGAAFDSLLPGVGEALAAVGFAAVAVDGRGTAGRDKAFHDHAYGAIDRASDLDDHVAAIDQLGARYPWLDTTRVGIHGHSAGGYAAARALMSHPDTYSVGVGLAGNHDNTTNIALWAEHYQGAPWTGDDAVHALSNPTLAAGLRGHLLLVHGELDDNAHPHQMLRLVDALIAADKDVDMLLVPGGDHGFGGRGHYVNKRVVDYLVRHLHGTEPPAYRFSPLPGAR